MDSKPEIQIWSRAGWWAIWFVTLIVSLVPPLFHHLRGVAEILEPFRYPWGLMPADLVMLRELGAYSQWIPVALLAVFVIAVRTPNHRKALIACGACLSSGFSAVYAGYCLLIITTYLPSYSNAMEGKRDLIQAFYPKKTKDAEQAAPLNGP